MESEYIYQIHNRFSRYTVFHSREQAQTQQVDPTKGAKLRDMA